MVGNTSNLQYSTLDTKKRQIRLLTILPGAWRSEVQCRLHIVSLQEKPDYEALSYTWGDANDTVPIRVDGAPFKATRNLWHALRRLRREKEPRIVWIDAICINQQDDKEKATQVAWMGEIYHSCRKALLFLGEDDSCANSTADAPPRSSMAEKFFQLIDLFASNKHLDKLSCFQKAPNSTLEWSKAYQEHLSAVEMLSQKPWWNRMWVVQEASLPAETDFMFAQESRPFDSILNALENEMNHRNDCCATFKTRNHFMNLQWSVTPFLFARILVRSASKRTIYDLLQSTLSMEASNERDLVYGILGLVNEWGPGGPVTPDYEGPVRQTFASALLNIIQINFTYALQGRRTLHASRALPSWFPDWIISTLKERAAAEERRALHTVLQHFDAARGTRHAVKLQSDCTLVVHAVKVQSLRAVAPYSDLDSPPHFEELVRQWMDFAGVTDFPLSAGRGPPDPRPVALWRTVALDQTSKPFLGPSRRVTAADYETFAQASRKSLGEGFETIHGAPWLFVWNKRLFLTESDDFGMAYKEAAPHDEVYVILGCRLPLLLRRSGKVVKVDGCNDPVPTFTVIGDCYLHGIMDGEALKGDWEKRIEMIVLV